MSDYFKVPNACTPKRDVALSRSINGMVPTFLLPMNCGGVPVFDEQSGVSYICDKCYAVIGSISQPRACVEMNSKT